MLIGKENLHKKFQPPDMNSLANRRKEISNYKVALLIKGTCIIIYIFKHYLVFYAGYKNIKKKKHFYVKKKMFQNEESLIDLQV